MGMRSCHSFDLATIRAAAGSLAPLIDPSLSQMQVALPLDLSLTYIHHHA
jgi:hypothetical protein